MHCSGHSYSITCYAPKYKLLNLKLHPKIICLEHANYKLIKLEMAQLLIIIVYNEFMLFWVIHNMHPSIYPLLQKVISFSFKHICTTWLYSYHFNMVIIQLQSEYMLTIIPFLATCVIS